NIWNDEDFFVGKDFVGGRSGGSVGAFTDDFCLDARGVLAGDDVLRGRGNQDVAIGQQELFGIISFSLGVADDRLVGITMLQQAIDVDAVLVVEAAIVFSNADDLVAGVLHELGGVGAHVAKALNDHTRGFAGHLKLSEGFIAVDHHAAARGFAASAGAA